MGSQALPSRTKPRSTLPTSVFSATSQFLILMPLFGASLVAQQVKKKSACSAGEPSSTPRSGRFPGEGTGYPLQYSWASLVAQMVKIPPAMWKTWVQSLDWEDPLEEGRATHWRRAWQPTPVSLPGESPGQRSLAGVHEVAKSQT